MRLSGNFEFTLKDQKGFTCSFVGLKEGQFLIFEIHLRSVDELFIRKLNGANVVFRGFSDTENGHVIAFRSTVISMKSMGTRLLFVKYPISVESKPVRMHKRFKVNFDAEVYVENKRYEARFLDISQSGCAVLIKNESVELEQGDEIFIEPGIKNIPKPYPQCKVVNVRHQADGTVVGVELTPELDLTDELKLEVFSHIILEH
ncbi:PilZ domain-containing protein [Vibrio sp. HN007]|uniref:PilZ domain-containing protein n=1 Tax=Vibrio iocasae TaxID=3098914 RepID=UPI0035D4F21B